MKFLFLAIFCAAIFSGCVTLRGVVSSQKGFESLSDKSCIEDAMKKVTQIQFVKYRLSDRVAENFEGRPIKIRSHSFRYTINGTDHFASVDIEERTSEVKVHDGIEFWNRYTKGKWNNDQEKELVKTAIKAVNDSIEKNCNLKNFSPSEKVW